MKSKKIIVNDKMQKNYVYNITEPKGRNFASDFKPELTPKKMLELGIFGGRYMRDCKKEFPKNWFDITKFFPDKLSGHDKNLNYFKVEASQSLLVWRKKGWIHKDDPRGWFQWYCRYYMGRRHQDDARQIRRWKAFRRHVAQIQKNCWQGDLNCRARQRQAVLHWAYDSTKL